MQILYNILFSISLLSSPPLHSSPIFLWKRENLSETRETFLSYYPTNRQPYFSDLGSLLCSISLFVLLLPLLQIRVRTCLLVHNYITLIILKEIFHMISWRYRLLKGEFSDRRRLFSYPHFFPTSSFFFFSFLSSFFFYLSHQIDLSKRTASALDWPYLN